MNHSLKLRQIGSSVGVIVPKRVLEQLNVEKGDDLYLVEDSGGYRLIANDPTFAAAMESYRKIARRHRNVFKELAK